MYSSGHSSLIYYSRIRFQHTNIRASKNMIFSIIMVEGWFVRIYHKRDNNIVSSTVSSDQKLSVTPQRCTGPITMFWKTAIFVLHLTVSTHLCVYVCIIILKYRRRCVLIGGLGLQE